MTGTTEPMHTVAVSISGFNVRVLVDQLAGSPHEAEKEAVEIVRVLALYMAREPHKVKAAVVRTDELTTLDPQPQQITA